MPVPRLTDSDRVRVRYHLGYLNIEPVQSIQLGFPAAQQAEFLVETAMDRLMAAAVPKLLEILNTLECIEGLMRQALPHLLAQQIGELKIRNTNEEGTSQDLLEKEYARWAKRLADHLGVPLNVYSTRFQGGLYGGVPLSTPVSGI